MQINVQIFSTKPFDESVSAVMFAFFFFVFSLSLLLTHTHTSICLVWSSLPSHDKKTTLKICVCATEEASSLHQSDAGGYNYDYADELACPSTSILSWPPPHEDDQRYTPTASPLYIPPPGTQHVQVMSTSTCPFGSPANSKTKDEKW